MENASIYLHGMDAYVTQTENCAFLVRSGTIYVYIVPWTNNSAGRRILLCESPAGSVIPSLVYRDKDYKQWRFSFVAQGEVELVPMQNAVTKILLKKFSTRAGLQSFAEEGFENSVVDYYKREVVKDDVFIERGKKQEPVVKKEAYSTIQGAFRDGNDRVQGNNLQYKIVAYICKRLGQTVTSEAKTSASLHGAATIPTFAQALGLICREVVLDNDWYKNDCGCMIVTHNDKQYACFRSGLRGYSLYDPETEKTEKLKRSMAAEIAPKAFYLGKTLPDRALKAKDLLQFGLKAYQKSDLFMMLLLGLACTLIGILLPTLNQQLYDDYIPMGSISSLTQICIVIGAFMIGNLFFSVVKSLSEFRIQNRVGYAFQDAIYYRVFRLPESFFRDYESADMAQRLQSVGQTVNTFVRCAVISSISALFSILYLVKMFKYSGKLGWISMLMVAIYAAILIPVAKRQIKYDQQDAEERGRASSKLYQYLNGIAKIRMAGVEDRAALEYMRPFSNVQSVQIKKNKLSAITLTLSGVVSTIFSMVLYYIVINSKIEISMGAFVGFNTALGTFTGAIIQLIGDLLSVYGMTPTYKRFKPLLTCASETEEDCDQPGKLTGDVDVSHVTFAYTEGQKPVLDNLSLRIRPGEYLGIVGSSGCGKSTLLKLLLGFEKPLSGHISFDGKDLASLDKQAFRKNLGVVLQNGKLISGSIFENITITAPDATAQDVQRVVEAVGLKDDIAQMPMGIHTVLSENSNTISGGQQQRILIARAIIRQPSILIFDEATSALDNLTQAAVCESLDKMHVTRIVVAHRLSTIRSCDRIVVLQEGRIVEEGNFESLMQQHGLFYQLASRQIAE